MRVKGFVLSPMTTLGNSKIDYTVYTKGNKARVTVRAVEELSQM
jgi:hypothetical protein